MDAEVTEVTQKTESELKLYTISDAARAVGVSYMAIKYAIANQWIVLCHRDPDLIDEEQLESYAANRGLTFFK